MQRQPRGLPATQPWGSELLLGFSSSKLQDLTDSFGCNFRTRLRCYSAMWVLIKPNSGGQELKNRNCFWQ